MTELENKIGYTFKNKDLLQTALTHSSYANEGRNKKQSYERLEFLGDSVLGFIVAEYLYENMPDISEGDLTKRRASLVCEKSLCVFSREISLGKHIRLSKGEQHSGGSDRPSILADVFEAILAAIYMDSGIEEAKKFVLRFIIPQLSLIKSQKSKDYKTTLQEIIQQNPEEKIEYIMIDESGPDHNKHFVYAVYLNSNEIGRGGGKSKKEAEQQAAREALELMGY